MTKNITLLIAMFIMFVSGYSIAQQPSPVKVQDGLLQGTYEDGLSVYKGIPFAAPPVGDLRCCDVLQPNTAHRSGSKRRIVEESGCIFHLATDAGRRSMGYIEIL